MELPAGLAADLARLTDALDDPGTDLADLLGSLHDAFLVAVPSGLGLSVTIRVECGRGDRVHTGRRRRRRWRRPCGCRWGRGPTWSPAAR